MQIEARYRLKAFLLSAYSQNSTRNTQDRWNKAFDIEALLRWVDENLNKCTPVEMIAKKLGYREPHWLSASKTN